MSQIIEPSYRFAGAGKVIEGGIGMKMGNEKAKDEK